MIDIVAEEVGPDAEQAESAAPVAAGRLGPSGPADEAGLTHGSAADDPLTLEETTPSFEVLFPATRYFEIDSRIAGQRFCAWVTTPTQYEAEPSQSFPVVYQVDGNLFFPTTAPLHQAGQSDSMSPLRPFILVSVGYVAPESSAWTWLRVRDLLPPGEPVPEVMNQALEMSVEAGFLTRAEGDRYRDMFTRPAADKFLAFLEDELHPLVQKAFRIDGSDVGLWGDSYGGLFATYVAIQRSKLFKIIGAGSPGIVGEDSQIFRLYREAAASGKDYAGRRLHVTLATREFSEPSIYRSLIARGTGELLAQTSLHPLQGLQVSTEMIPLETHLTGAVPAWFSFLRACYARS